MAVSNGPQAIRATSFLAGRPPPSSGKFRVSEVTIQYQQLRSCNKEGCDEPHQPLQEHARVDVGRLSDCGSSAFRRTLQSPHLLLRTNVNDHGRTPTTSSVDTAHHADVLSVRGATYVRAASLRAEYRLRPTTLCSHASLVTVQMREGSSASPSFSIARVKLPK
jgi:hypothetical protein